jgi:hypothetical protein
MLSGLPGNEMKKKEVTGNVVACERPKKERKKIHAVSRDLDIGC